MQIEGYEITEHLHESVKSNIYRGVSKGDKEPVVIKVLKYECLSVEDLNRFAYEYDIMRKLDLPGVIKVHDFIECHNTKAIIMEDIRGESLTKLVQLKKGDFGFFLNTAIKIATILRSIHKNSVIYKDVKPQNILFNSETETVKIIDFGLATHLSREVQEIVSPGFIGGTIPYISPEQTGRMNRSIDYRSDFYSLGVTFYQMLTGRLPFISNDLMELVHSHIAKTASTPHELDHNIPKVLSDIVMKLMEKKAENRYQSAQGLIDDLKECSRQLEENQAIKAFQLAKNDIPDRFQIPEKLYGRKKEKSQIINAFQRAVEGTMEVLFVSGKSGIGKSALINESHKPLAGKRGYFISGKFDHLEKSIPYTAIIQAFRSLTRQILTEGAEKLEYWKTLISNGVGKNGQLLVDVIPEIELLIGPQPAVSSLPPEKTQNRFNLLFQNFVKGCANEKHPLVLFIDDLQWADNASLNLISQILTDPGIGHLLFVGAYRDNEVDSVHPFSMMRESIKDEVQWEELRLNSLNEEQIAFMVADTLHHQKSEVLELATLIAAKTDGNPFFIKEFLLHLYRDELIRHDKRWQWDIQKIKEAEITDNVVELLTSKIEKQDESIKELLAAASCFGSIFNIQTMGVILEKSEEAVNNLINTCVNQGFFIRIGNTIRFVHDKVEEAAYSTLTDKKREKLHYEIGYKLLKDAKKEDRVEEKIFAIVKQLNQAFHLIEPAKKQELCELNQLAGKKAKKSTAYKTALSLFEKAIDLLPENAMEREYSKTFALHKEWVESLYLTKNVEKAKEQLEWLVEIAQTDFDKVAIYNIQNDLYRNLMEYDQAINVTLRALKLLGYELPETEEELTEQFTKENEKVTQILSEKTMDDLYNIQVTTSEKEIIINRLLSEIFGDGTMAGQMTLAFLAVLKMFTHTLQYGNTEHSALLYIFLQIVILTSHDYDKAYQLGKLAMRFSADSDDASMNCTVYHEFGLFTSGWKQHLRENEKYYLKSVELGMESGNLSFCAYNYIHLGSEPIIYGKNLFEQLENTKKYLLSLQRLKDHGIYQMVQATSSQPIKNLTEVIGSDTFSDEEFDEEEYKKQYTQLPMIISQYYYNKIRSLYLFERYEEAFKLANDNEEVVNIGISFFPKVVEYYFYYALSLIQILENAETDEKKQELWEKFETIEKKIKLWAETCPENVLHKHLLLLAEQCRLREESEKGMAYYEQAIEEANKVSYVNNEGLANELAAKFYLHRGLKKIAVTYLREAHHCYVKWGATAKVNLLLKTHRSLFQSFPNRLLPGDRDYRSKKLTDSSHSGSSGSLTSMTLDLDSIIKSSQAIVSEVEMRKLMTKMIKILTENSGAQKGFLILRSKDGTLTIKAESNTESQEEIMFQSTPLNQCDKLSISIVRYVAKTDEIVVLENASEDGIFVKDEYVVQNQTHSVLCMPIIKHGKQLGVLYLENNLLTGSFTTNHVDTLRILSANAAISIENALLYEELKEWNTDLEKRVEARTLELYNTNQELQESMEELKKTQKKLVQAEKMAVLGGMVAGVAHEINTPVGICVTSSSFLENKTNQFEVKYNENTITREDLEVFINDTKKVSISILKNLKKAADLIKTFRMVAVDQGTEEKRKFNLKQYIHDVLLSLKSIHADTNHKITVLGDDSAEIFSYPGTYYQIITSLLSNSILHGFENGEGEIVIEIEQQENRALLTYHDNGKGIEPDHLEKVFDPFFTTKRAKGGVGLGLNIVYNLVTQRLNGEIRCESTPGKGTTFFITDNLS